MKSPGLVMKILVQNSVSTEYDDAQLEIVPFMTGGLATEPGEYPFIARMGWLDPHNINCASTRCGQCGATLISRGNGFNSRYNQTI